MPLKGERLTIADVILFHSQPRISEERYREDEFDMDDLGAYNITAPFRQINHSRSAPGVLRGLHYQLPPHDEAKLVRCVRGAVFDVAVDVRQSSSDFGKWVGELLSEENHRMLYIPAGFAHAFCVVGDEPAEVIYQTTNLYSPGSARGIIWDDPEIGVAWPEGEKQLSEKDAALPVLKNADLFP